MPNQAQLSLGDSGAAPQTYDVPKAQLIRLLCCNAVFDGSGAGAAFLPAIVLLSDDDQVVARMVASSSVAAGASAEVTFAPLLSAGGSGIRYDVENAGGFLHSTTTLGVHITDGGEILLDVGPGTGQLDLSNNLLVTVQTIIDLVCNDGELNIRNDGTWTLTSSKGTLNVNGSGDMTFTPTGELNFQPGGGIQSTVGAAGGASALPATPLGYLPISPTEVVPVYNRS